MTQANLLIQAFFLITKSGVCPETTPEEWKKILLYTHSKGYLYAHVTEEKLDMIACMYRVKSLSDKNIDVYPEKEKGNILYVPFFASTQKDNTLAISLFKSIIDKKGNIKEIAFHDLKDGKLKRYKRSKRRNTNVKTKVAVSS
jgi:hypothetical protein